MVVGLARKGSEVFRRSDSTDACTALEPPEMRKVPWIPIAIITVMVFMAIFAPLLAPYSPINQTLADIVLGVSVRLDQLAPTSGLSPNLFVVKDPRPKNVGRGKL